MNNETPHLEPANGYRQPTGATRAEYDGEPLAETRQPVRTQSAPFNPYTPDRRTRADDVRLEIVTDSGQGGLFEE